MLPTARSRDSAEGPTTLRGASRRVEPAVNTDRNGVSLAMSGRSRTSGLHDDRGKSTESARGHPLSGAERKPRPFGTKSIADEPSTPMAVHGPHPCRGRERSVVARRSRPELRVMAAVRHHGVESCGSVSWWRSDRPTQPAERQRTLHPRQATVPSTHSAASARTPPPGLRDPR